MNLTTMCTIVISQNSVLYKTRHTAVYTASAAFLRKLCQGFSIAGRPEMKATTVDSHLKLMP